ncbi:MAG: DUF1292 domain-containing protein [Ruminococcaceae bacterium]|nr:DUF1292 domain-containing protein [Oscillospiraceae bacterium]
MEFDNTVILQGDDGQDYTFEVLDVIEYEGNQYVILLGDGEDEVTILMLDAEGGDEETESYSAVEDEAVLQAVFDIFKENNSDIFDFAD